MLNPEWRSNLCCVLILSVPVLVFSRESKFEIGTTMTIKSEALDREMNILVHLPDNYNESDRHYPVVYIMGYGTETRYALAAATLEVMQKKGEIPPMILVGIYLPDGNGVLIPRDQDTTEPDRYLAYLTKEVFPLVETSYRTADYRILYGASNSGLFVVYSLLRDPGLFHAYIASSPMLGWCEDLLTEMAMKAFEIKDLPLRQLYVVYSDDDDGRVTEAVPDFVEILKTNGPLWLNHFCELRINEGHVPVNDVSLALKAIFPDCNPTMDLTTADEFKDYYDRLTERYGFKILPPGGILFDTALDHALAGRLDIAREIFAYQIALYPNWAYGHAGLGYVHMKQGDTVKARESLLQSVAIDPENGWAKRMLKELEEE